MGLGGMMGIDGGSFTFRIVYHCYLCLKLQNFNFNMHLKAFLVEYIDLDLRLFGDEDNIGTRNE